MFKGLTDFQLGCLQGSLMTMIDDGRFKDPDKDKEESHLADYIQNELKNRGLSENYDSYNEEGWEGH